MCLADRFLVGAGHEAEGLTFLQIHMRGMTESAELFGSFLERVELLEELFFAEFLCWETAFVLIVCIDEVLHGDAPRLSSCAYTQHVARLDASLRSKSCSPPYIRIVRIQNAMI